MCLTEAWNFGRWKLVLEQELAEQELVEELLALVAVPGPVELQVQEVSVVTVLVVLLEGDSAAIHEGLPSLFAFFLDLVGYRC